MDTDRDAEEGGAKDPPKMELSEEDKNQQLGKEANGGRDAGERADAEAEGAGENGGAS